MRHHEKRRKKKTDDRKVKEKKSKREKHKKCKIEIFSQHIVASYLQSMLCCKHIKRRAYLWTSLFCMFLRTWTICGKDVVLCKGIEYRI
jgi:hypothetical protein